MEGSDYMYPVQPGQKNAVHMKLTGGRGRDFRNANMLANIPVEPGKHAPDDHMWNHRADLGVIRKGWATLELCRIDAHLSTQPHDGSSKQFSVDNNGKKYKTW